MAEKKEIMVDVEKDMAEAKRKMNIIQRMLNVEMDIERVSKNLEISVGKNSYKAVSEADVLKAVREAESKHGVFSYPCEREIVDSGELVSAGYQGQEKKNLYMRVRVTYRFVNVYDPSDFIEMTSFGDGIDTGDKAPGKAMTYADKYALMKAYKIVTGDDPDQEGSQELRGFRKNPANPQGTMMATAAQKQFIGQLMKEKGISQEEMRAKWGAQISGGMTQPVANAIIGWLQGKGEGER